MAVLQYPDDHTTADVFLMLYMVSKGNATKLIVHGKTTLQASRRNASTTPPSAKLAIT
jgi:hypothetical protein